MKSNNTFSTIMILFAILLSASVMTSCREKEQKVETTTNEAPTETNVTNEASSSNSGGDIALNPAHGQPGHRCDIPVGAPLDGSSSTTQNVTPTSTSPVINSGNSGAKLNPAHGQPGHRCDIKVGDPLPEE